MQLIIPTHVLREIRSLIAETTEDVETGVSLFGVWTPSPLVLAVCGPGPRAVHAALHYTGDDGYATAVYLALRCALPGIKWLGEFHAHPAGMPQLSSGDLKTVRRVLAGAEGELRPEALIAGVLQRAGRKLDIHPFYFDRTYAEGKEKPTSMEITEVDADDATVRAAQKLAMEGTHDDLTGLCKEPEGSGGALQETPPHRRRWQWWKRHRAHGGAGGGREAHAH
jgi:hypothetical protein